MSLFSANSAGSSTPTYSVASSILGDSSTQDQTRTKRKNWLVLQVKRGGELSPNVEHVLCLVDPNEPTAVAADKLEGLIVKVLAPNAKVRFSINYVCLPRIAERPKPFHATLEHLVEHLREFDISPSSNPGTPSLWDSGTNLLEVYRVYEE